MQNKGSGNSDELLKNLRAMFDPKGGDGKKAPAKKKGTDRNADDDYDKRLNSRLSDTMARAMKNGASESKADSSSKASEKIKVSHSRKAEPSERQEDKHTYAPTAYDDGIKAEVEAVSDVKNIHVPELDGAELEGAELDENAASVEADEYLESASSDDGVLSTASVESAESVENIDAIDNIENMESVENTENVGDIGGIGSVLESVLQELAPEPSVDDRVSALYPADPDGSDQLTLFDTKVENAEETPKAFETFDHSDHFDASNVSDDFNDSENSEAFGARSEIKGADKEYDVADIDDDYPSETSALQDIDDATSEYYMSKPARKNVSAAASAKAKRSAAMIADLMDDLGRIGNEGDGDEYIASPENEDEAFAASLAELSGLASEGASNADKYDDGIIKRRGFVANDADIENIVQIPGTGTYQVAAVKKSEPSKVQMPKKQSRRKDGKRLGDKDISLAMRFGYEYELAERIGYDKVRERMQRSESVGGDPSRMKNTFGYCGSEFSVDTDIETVRARFARSLKGLKVRTILTSIIFLLLLAVENLSLFGNGKINIPFVEAHPVYVNIVSFVLFLTAVLMSLKPLLIGFKDALRFNCSEYSAASFSVFSVAVYDIVAAVMLVLKDEQYFMLNTVTVLGILLTLISRCLDYKREYRAFFLMSDGEKKYCAEQYSPIVKNNGKPIENKFQSSFITEKTDIVEGYFERTSRMSEWYKKQSFIIAPIFALALLVFVISYLNGKNLLLSYSYLVTAVTVCMPISMVLFNSVSFACASKDMNKRGCAVIGEQAADEYSEAYGIVFREKAMLNASFNSIDRERSCGDADMQEIIKYICKLVSLIDSAASEPIISVLGGKGYSDAELKIERIDPDGIEAFSPENHRILLGEREFMVRHRIAVRPAGIKVNSEDVFRKTLGYLYIAVDDMICWKVVLDYETKKDFLRLAEILASEGVHTGVETVNPNINEDFLLKHRLPSSVSTVSSDRFAVNGSGEADKSAKDDSNGIASKNSGIIAKRECDMIYPLLWCKRIKRNQCFGMRVTFIMIAVALTVLSLTAVFGLHTSLSSAMLTLLFLILNVPAMLSGLFNSPIPNIDITEDKNVEIQK